MTNLARQIPSVLECIHLERWGRKAPMVTLVAARTWEEDGIFTTIDRPLLARLGRTGYQATWDLRTLQRLEEDRVLRSIGNGHRKAWRLAGDDPGIVRRWHHVPWIMAKGDVIGYLRGHAPAVARARTRVIARQNAIGELFDPPSERRDLALLRLGLVPMGREQVLIGRDLPGLLPPPSADPARSAGPPYTLPLTVPSEQFFPLEANGQGEGNGTEAAPPLSEAARRLVSALSATTGFPVFPGSDWERRLAQLADNADPETLAKLIARAKAHTQTRMVPRVIADLEAYVEVALWRPPAVERCQRCVRAVAEISECWDSQCPRQA